MSFVLEQDVNNLENTLNQVGDFLGVIHPLTLEERFTKLRQDQQSSEVYPYLRTRTCCCTGNVEQYTTIYADDEDLPFCLVPIMALVLGTDLISDTTRHKIKKAIFDGSNDYPACNLPCLLNEWKDSPCFKRFVIRFGVRSIFILMV